MSSILLFTLFYLLISGCILYPPNEFISAGLTIELIFSKLLGSENGQFIQYHIKKTVYTVIIHSLLPFAYVFGIYVSSDNPDIEFSSFVYTYRILVAFTVVLPASTFLVINYWAQENWISHPISKNLKCFCNNDTSWISVASSINTEFRRIDKICIQLNSIHKLVVTDNWILKITPYTIYCAHQSDSVLVVNRSDSHNISQQTHGEVQFINIEVKSTRTDVQPFAFRLNALDFKDLQDKINRPITVLPTVSFHKTIVERFIDAFKQQVSLNPKFRTTQDLENCIGCMQVISNVKLQKNCADDISTTSENNCVVCHCRPMWCIDCIAKWFVSRQDESENSTWLSSKCTCPLCRNRFCVLDVSLIENS